MFLGQQIYYAARDNEMSVLRNLLERATVADVNSQHGMVRNKSKECIGFNETNILVCPNLSLCWNISFVCS